MMDEVLAEIAEVGSDSHAIEKAYLQVLAEEEQIKSEIIESVKTNEDWVLGLRHEIGGLEEAIPSLQAVFDGIEKLNTRIRDTKDMADVVSMRVREIDTARSNAILALKFVQRTLQLRSCLKGVKENIENGNTAEAAKIIQVYSENSSGRERSKSSVDFTHSSHQEGITELLMYQESLAKSASDDYAKAVEARNDIQVLQACKILAQLGDTDIAVTKFIEYGVRLHEMKTSYEIETTCEAIGRAKLTPEYNPYGGNAETEESQTPTLLNLFVTLLNENASIMQHSFAIVKKELSNSNESMGIALSLLHDSCNKNVYRVSRLFLESNLLETRIKHLASDRTNVIGAMSCGSNWDGLNPQEKREQAIVDLDTLLDEMALLLKHANTYVNFVTGRYEKYEIPFDDRIQRELNTVIEEICSFYAIFEEAYMKAAVNVAIEQEVLLECTTQVLQFEHVTESKVVHVSSLAEDVFFVFDKCRDRALAISRVSSTCSVVNSLVSLIDGKLRECLYDRVTSVNKVSTFGAQSQERFESFRAAATTGFQSIGKVPVTEAPKEEPSVTSCETGLNTITLCVSYIGKLLGEFEASADTLASVDKKEQLKSCTDGFFACIDAFHRTRDAGSEKLIESVKSSLISNVESTFGSSGIVYEISEEAYLQKESKNDSVTAILDFSKDRLGRLCEKIDWETSCHIGMKWSMIISRYFESCVVRKRFTPFGALLLDKQLRSFVYFFEHYVSAHAATEFHRLQQISNILNVDQVNDVLDVFNPNDSLNVSEGVRTLAAKEVKRVLALRVDIKSEDIKKLKI